MAKPSKWDVIKKIELETSKGTKVEVKLIQAKENPEVKMIAINKLAQNIAVEVDLRDKLIKAIKEVSS